MRIGSSAIPAILVIVASSFAQTDPDSAIVENNVVDSSATAQADRSETTTQVPFTLRLIPPAGFDSVISLLPSADSIRAADRIISVAIDTLTGEIILFTLGADGLPQRSVMAAPPQIVSQRPAQLLNQDGRTFFMIWSALKSAYVYPASLGTFQMEDRLTGGLSLLSVGSTLYGTYLFTSGRELGYGRVGLMNSGSTLFGISYPTQIGLLLAYGTGLDESINKTDRDGNQYTEDPSRADIARSVSAMIGFPLGIYLGSKVNLPGVSNDDYGKVSVMHFLGVQSSTLHGYMWPMLFVEASDSTGADSTYLTVASALSMGLTPAGYALGYYLVRDRNVSSGRGMMVWLTGYMGGLTGLMLPFLGESDLSPLQQQRIAASSILAGHILGTALGFTYHADQDYTFWQTAFIGASAAGGSAIALSLPLLAQTSRRQPYILASVAGGWAGFYLGEKLSGRLFEKASPDQKHGMNIAVDVPIIALWPQFFGQSKADSPVPVANVRASF